MPDEKLKAMFRTLHKNMTKWLPAAIILFVCGFAAEAQSYIRYVNPSDLKTKTAYADSVLSSISLPRGVAQLHNYPEINAAVRELERVLRDGDKELLEVWVCGSTSPDGLYGYNQKLSQNRTDAVTRHIMEYSGIPRHKIHAETIGEDWDRLYEMVEASDMRYRGRVMEIIRTKSWGERKEALQQLDGGRVWKQMERDFFPRLRCVRFAIFCKWDPSKPYLKAPEPQNAGPAPMPAPVSAMPSSGPRPKRDTIVVYDTVYVRRQVVYVDADQSDKAAAAVAPEQKQDVPAAGPQAAEVPVPVVAAIPVETAESAPVQYETKLWTLGLETNLAADALALLNLGLDFQLGKKTSLSIAGTYTRWNYFAPDPNTCIYGISPEFRYWFREVGQGHYLGLDANVLWYTLKWRDGLLYQNLSNSQPAWSLGLTYGYNVCLDRKKHWALGFFLGLGYGQYRQDVGAWDPDKNNWVTILDDAQKAAVKHHIGVTKVGVNLSYRIHFKKQKEIKQ